MPWSLPILKLSKRRSLKTCTVQDVLHWDIYDRYSKEQIDALFAGRPMLTSLDVLALDIEEGRRLDMVLRHELIDDSTLRLFATDCAERVLRRCEAHHGTDVDPRLWWSITQARRYARGEVSGKELQAAHDDARRTVLDRASAIACAVSADNFEALCLSINRAAFSTRAYVSEQRWQVGRLRELFLGEE